MYIVGKGSDHQYDRSILVLPAMFMIFDKIICKTSIDFSEEKAKKTAQ